MARSLRIQFPGAYYHVTCRGNARQEIFAGDRDRAAFLSLLKQSEEIYQIEVLAYVLMDNHFHFLVKTPLGNLQEFMRHFNISYTSYFNRRHKKTGHLYQGRYKSFLIDAENYLQEVSRYIHLNPIRVRAKSGLSLAEKRNYLRKYRWSSLGGYLERKDRVGFLKIVEVLGEFGGDTRRGRTGYERFVREGLEKGLKSPLGVGKGHGIVGEEDFVERVRRRFERKGVRSREVPGLRKVISEVEPKRILGVISKVMGVDEGELLGRWKREKGRKGERGLVMEMLYRYGGMNQREIGELMGLDYSAVSVGRKRFREAVEEDRRLGGLARRVETVISQE